MDAYEATRIVFSRIQNLDPENASKIMGYLLIQDHGEKEMIRLAFGPETLLHSLILKAHQNLNLTNKPSSNPPLSPPSYPISRQNSSSSSSWPTFQDFHNFDNNPIDDFQLQEQHLSYLSEPPQHRRSMSATDDICLGSDSLASGFGWKPCLYYARGYCKNGTACRFLHALSDPTDSTPPFPLVASPTDFDLMQQHHHQRPPQLLPSTSFSYSASQRAAAAGLMLGEDVHQFVLGRSRMDKLDMVNPASRQIYLTFPADSTFREEDVSNYFSIYGPVQDVRIPYQQKRMFGFVTFVFPETVKLILAKGNPHFVCDARVLVKPYKEKGKVPDRKQQQLQAERAEFSAPATPNGHDSYDMLLGMQMQSSPRMLYNNHEMILRRKLEEQAELQQAIELQSRRLLGLHLLDVNKQQYHRRNLSTGTVPIPSPTHSHPFGNHNFVIPTSSPDRISPSGLEENHVTSAMSLAAAIDQTSRQQAELNVSDCGKRESPNLVDCNFHDSVEHNLPDSPFASPTKSDGEPLSLIFTSAGEAEPNGSTRSVPSSLLSSSTPINSNSVDASSLSTTSTLDVTPFKSCFLQIPRFSSGHGAVQM